ncbi:hypothetical protein [Kitasatospora sp. NPDC085879]|uniref:hypothetical protein n=1 Tax=Kitasatospora sp. NPDC085879 TaxID=3154769 RepID=UPI003413250E
MPKNPAGQVAPTPEEAYTDTPDDEVETLALMNLAHANHGTPQVHGREWTLRYAAQQGPHRAAHPRAVDRVRRRSRRPAGTATTALTMYPADTPPPTPLIRRQGRSVVPPGGRRPAAVFGVPGARCQVPRSGGRCRGPSGRTARSGRRARGGVWWTRRGCW